MKRKWYLIVSVLVISVIILNGCEKGAKEGVDQEEILNESLALKSELEKVEECYLCGGSDASMMSYYRQYDSIGYEWRASSYNYEFSSTTGSGITVTEC